ncbi:head GIN domain-containing protein [uncultured Mucilaginibacter sp.]|uniref:head GIN domain-containing protein n=1 Tax=uncultured Mucilaginibacter sp. TaxID=797541 RepID=UPI0025E4E680|nr:head GIN domain-containing protein [uncultured Mucilaginibacter sp.]
MRLLTKILFAAALFFNAGYTFAQKTETRALTGFNAISVGGSFDVYVTQGSTESVKIEAADIDIKQVITEVKDGILRVYNKDEVNINAGDDDHDDWDNWHWNLNWGNNHKHKKEVVYINVNEVNSISVSGSGKLSFTDGVSANFLKLRVSGSGGLTGKVNAQTLETRVSGSGYMDLSGKADNCTIAISGSGHYTAQDLVTVATNVHVAGSGHATINASQKIDASVSGSGHIAYTGSATQVTISKHGSGGIRRI